ncbi:MAG: SHOCT domain-containing protein [Clostridia bacterium]|nr:SHOCT domain-containing protein [Clostridia bacterium]
MEPKEVVIIIVMALIGLIVLILAILYFKHKKIVIDNSALYEKIQLINRKYSFDYSIKPVLSFSQVCKSKRGLENFDFEKNLQKIIADNLTYYQHIINNLRNNSKLWVAYNDEYRSIESYSTQESIKDVKLSFKIFNWHEKLLYKSLILKKPTTAISVKYVATYTSPAGKNSYKLDKNFSHCQFESLLNEIVDRIREKELKEKEKEQRRIEREQRYDKVRKEKNMQKREDRLAEKEALYGSIETRERSLERREDRLAEKEALYGSIEIRERALGRREDRLAEKEEAYGSVESWERHLAKREETLSRREETLSRREEEFLVATRGHIYAVSDSPIPVEVEQPKSETREEALSTWSKMKRLKKAYDNGEITYEEYNEKRKNLL